MHTDANGWPCIGKYVGIVVDDSIKNEMDYDTLQANIMKKSNYIRAVELQYKRLLKLQGEIK